MLGLVKEGQYAQNNEVVKNITVDTVSRANPAEGYISPGSETVKATGIADEDTAAKELLNLLGGSTSKQQTQQDIHPDDAAKPRYPSIKQPQPISTGSNHHPFLFAACGGALSGSPPSYNECIPKSVSPVCRPGAPLPMMLSNASTNQLPLMNTNPNPSPDIDRCMAPGPISNYSISRPPLPTAAAPMITTPKTKPLGPERRMPFFRLEDFEILRVLGTGTFGRVFLSRYRSSGSRTPSKYFALKKLRKIDVIRLRQIDHIQNERAIMSRLCHPFIVKMYTAMQDHRHLYMLMEYAPGGELFHYLRRAGRLSLEAARFYMAELVLALEYLHSFGIAYRDLKPENLLLDSEGHLKLADFGFAKQLVPENITFTLCGTPEYLAPEIILGNGYGRGVDWWALGILLYEVLLGNPPFDGETPTAVYEKILRAEIHYPDHLPAPVVELLQGLLTVDVTQRLGCSAYLNDRMNGTERSPYFNTTESSSSSSSGAEAIKRMSFFDGIDWQAVERKEYLPPIVPAGEDEEQLGVNFPVEDCKSSMDVEVPNEMVHLSNHRIAFPGFLPA